MILLLSAGLGAMAGLGLAKSAPSVTGTAVELLGLPQLFAEHHNNLAAAEKQRRLREVADVITRLNEAPSAEDRAPLQEALYGLGPDLLASTTTLPEAAQAGLRALYGAALAVAPVEVPLYGTLLLTATEARGWQTFASRSASPDPVVREATWSRLPYYLFVLAGRSKTRQPAQ